MKKNLALLLAVALAFTCMLGFGVTAEESADDILVTVPMKATVSILYAVKAVGNDDATVVITAKDGVALDAPEAAEKLGTYQIGGVDYILFEYSNLAASEMDVVVTAKIGDKTVKYSHTSNIDDNDICYLKGANVRLYADSDMDDLVKTDFKMSDDKDVVERVKDSTSLDRDDYFYLPGKILHIDADCFL